MGRRSFFYLVYGCRLHLKTDTLLLQALLTRYGVYFHDTEDVVENLRNCLGNLSWLGHETCQIIFNMDRDEVWWCPWVHCHDEGNDENLTLTMPPPMACLSTFDRQLTDCQEDHLTLPQPQWCTFVISC